MSSQYLISSCYFYEAADRQMSFIWSGHAIIIYQTHQVFALLKTYLWWLKGFAENLNKINMRQPLRRYKQHEMKNILFLRPEYFTKVNNAIIIKAHRSSWLRNVKKIIFCIHPVYKYIYIALYNICIQILLRQNETHLQMCQKILSFTFNFMKYSKRKSLLLLTCKIRQRTFFQNLKKNSETSYSKSTLVCCIWNTKSNTYKSLSRINHLN